MKTFVCAALVFFTGLYALCAQDSRPAAAKPEDFAGRMTLSAMEGELMYLELPENVYRHVERRDLADIRVFDAGGNPVPCEVRAAPGISETPRPLQAPFFSWTAGEKTLPGQANIEIDSGGAVIRVNPAAAAGTPQLRSFLIDLSGLPYHPLSLVLETESGGQWNSPVTLQYSEDLAIWRLFDKPQTIARFGAQAGDTADRDTISLPEHRPPYILITINDTVPPLLAVKALFKTVNRPGALRETLFPGKKSADGFSVTYATGGYFPGVALDFILPRADSMNVEIFCRYSEEQEWQFWNGGTIYRLNAAAGAEKNKAWAGEASAPYWLLKAAGDLPFASVPDMQLTWEPRRLVFLARGPGPWILAYGNRDYGPVREALPGPLREQKASPASVAGAEHWTPRASAEEETVWNQVFLWGALILAVTVLSAMAFFMAKSMKKM
ncbi:MAG: DUF3999 domain-containing protein [Spirochaetales bacterium]|jgi:hypothetical protein|nr:DUF3999 domain-containing protein [Spirochaetales bacterium]